MNLEQEALTLSKYLIGERPGSLAVRLYVEHVDRLVGPMSTRQQRIWRICLRHPLLLSSADFALGLFDKYNPIRHRIFVMNCILEVQPEFSRYFLPQ